MQEPVTSNNQMNAPMDTKTNKELQYVIEGTRKERIRFEAEFERNKKEFLRRVSTTKIDIFNLSPLRDLLSEIRNACEKLFSSCEGLIRTFHRECSRLADDQTSYALLREISSEMAEIISDCHVTFDFDGSLDGIDLGDLAKVEFTASLEAQSIAKSWESRCNIRKTVEDRQSQEKRDQVYVQEQGISANDVAKHRTYLELREKEDRINTSQEAAACIASLKTLNGYLDSEQLIKRLIVRKIELSQKEKLARSEKRKQFFDETEAEEEKVLQREKEKKDYEIALAVWGIGVKKIEEQRRKELELRANTYKKERRKKLDRQLSEAMEAAEALKQKAENKKQKAKTDLASLSAFKLGEKKAQKNLIAEAEAEIKKAEQKKKEANAAYEEAVNGIESETEAYLLSQRLDVEKRIPMPQKPEMPAFMYEEEQRKKAAEAEEKSPSQMSNSEIAEILPTLLEPDRWYRLSEIKELHPSLSMGEGTQRTAVICRSLEQVDKYLSKKVDYNRVIYYKLNSAARKEKTEPQAQLSDAEKEKADQALQKKILLAMREEKQYTLNEIKALIPELVEESGNQHVAVLCKKMQSEGLLELTIENRILYYSL